MTIHATWQRHDVQHPQLSRTKYSKKTLSTNMYQLQRSKDLHLNQTMTTHSWSPKREASLKNLACSHDSWTASLKKRMERVIKINPFRALKTSTGPVLEEKSGDRSKRNRVRHQVGRALHSTKYIWLISIKRCFKNLSSSNLKCQNIIHIRPVERILQ